MSSSFFTPYAAKMWALALAPYRRVLLLDSDNHPHVPPERLLSNHVLRENGAILWPDYWPGSAWSDLLQGLEIANSTEELPSDSPLRGSHESGQLLIDRKWKWRSILLTLFQQLTKMWFSIGLFEMELALGLEIKSC